MNPNDYDDGDQQVMSRPSTTANVEQGIPATSTPIVNGVASNIPLRLDMDGEVTGPVEVPELRGGKGVGASAAVPVGMTASRQPDPVISRTPSSTRDFLQTHVEQSEGTNLAEFPSSSGLTTRQPPQGPEAPPTVEQRPSRNGDSVEYASVASTVTRREQQRMPIEDSGPQGTPLFDLQAIEQLQRLHASAPQLLGASPMVGNPRPPSTSSSDIQAEVRRQLGEMVAGYEEEARRLRSQVEALVVENHELRVHRQSDEDVQGRSLNPRQWLGNQSGFPSFGWLGRGLGSIIGGATPAAPRTLDLGPGPPSVGPPQPTLRPITSWIYPHPTEAVPPPPPQTQAQAAQVVTHDVQQAYSRPSSVPPVVSLGESPGARVVVESDLSQACVGAECEGVDVSSAFEIPPPPPQGHAERLRGDDDMKSDPMNVVLKGMAQLQDLVSEMSASPKQGEKPETVKPGVTSLPDLPSPGAESCLLFSDWIHNSKPSLSDISDTSEELWDGVLKEASTWYARYLTLDPLSRLVSQPEPSEFLSRTKWSRVSRRIETMILAALPATVRQEVSASRVSGLLPLVCKLYVIYAPGGITERELGLRHIQEPPACAGVLETIEGLRKWKRWCLRMTELGGTLPDPALQVRALTKLTRNTLQAYPDISFRVNLVRHTLQVDVNPDSEKVTKLHAQLLSELEMIGHRGPPPKDNDKSTGATQPPVPAKVKGVDAQDSSSAAPKAPRVPKPPPKAPNPPKAPTPDTSPTGKTLCTFYLSPSGCKKGSDCNFEHSWSSIPFEERKGRCKTCGAKGHKSQECKAGLKEGEPKGKGKGGSKGAAKASVEAVTVPSPPPPPAADSQQQIKSMLADAALILQQAMPKGEATITPEATTQGVPVATSPKATTPAVAKGTPVSLAALSAQLDSLRAMTREYEAKMMRFQEENDKISAVALLDSGATHPVVPFESDMSDLQKVPVTLAGDSKQEWFRTRGGTLVVPPGGVSEDRSRPQTILPLGALVENLGCSLTWSKRGGLKVRHPALGVLKTGVGRNTCPFLQEDQALSLIAELEDKRLQNFKGEMQELESRMELVSAPLDPTEALRQFAVSGARQDALKALLSQPYAGSPCEEVVCQVAEDLIGVDEQSGKRMMKQLPINRARRRALLSSEAWAVHLCSGKPKSENPIRSWAEERNVQLLEVDVLAKGGKGWNLKIKEGVWRVLLWAAATGRIVSIFSSPHDRLSGEDSALGLQPMFLWSLASVARGCGVPYVFEAPIVLEPEYKKFIAWSGGTVCRFDQANLGGNYTRSTTLYTNVDLAGLSLMPTRQVPYTRRCSGMQWSPGLRAAIVRALQGRYVGLPAEELDRVIAEGLRPTAAVVKLRDDAPDEVKAFDDDDAEPPPVMNEVEDYTVDGAFEPSQDPVPPDGQKHQFTKKEIESWRQHLLDGHVPYRRDCRLCVEGAGIGIQHRRVVYPQSFALSIDLFGPVPKHEHGRDETCISGKNSIRYGLIGAFRVPKSAIHHSMKASKEAGVEDLFEDEPKGTSAQRGRIPSFQEEAAAGSGHDLVEDCADYVPSEPGEPLDEELRNLLELDDDGGTIDQQDLCQAITAEDLESILAPQNPPGDPKELETMIRDLKTPVDQTVLRFCIPLRSKTGQDVLEGLQKMVLDINKKYPVKIIHSDPGTEFSSYALSRWAASQGIRVQHTLPTDKKGNGLAERIVGWVKSRVRTLLKAASLPIHWWPLAARWATHAHNRSVEGLPPLPSFGHSVLHRTKTPKDADRQILGRWVRYRYAAPHSSIPDGHVLITESGNVVASRGFRDKVIDPLEYDDLKLPELEATDEVLEAPTQVDSGGVPERRLRGKTAIRFIDTLFERSSEVYSHECIMKEDYTNESFHALMNILMTEEGGTLDRRGDLQDKLVFGAYCHGGKRGVTKLTYRRPLTTQFLNQVLLRGLNREDSSLSPRWTSLMLMRSGDVPVHRDYRNEWGSKNHVLCIPGGLLLWTDEAFDSSKRVKVVSEPDWSSKGVTTITGNTVTFDPRAPHAVRKQPEWVLVGYTPLGAKKLPEEAQDYLKARGFNLTEEATEDYRIAMISADEKEENLEDDCPEGASSMFTTADLEQDVQLDSSTALVGWDFSKGDPADVPLEHLNEGDLRGFLEEKGVLCEYERLTQLGVEEPSDLQYLYEEDLIEMGLPRIHAQRIMSGIHPEGTRRSDNPSVCGLQTGESRLITRDQMFLPRVLQNRTLDPGWQGGPPVRGIGVQEHVIEPVGGPLLQEEGYEVDVWEDEWIPFEELGIFPSDSPSTQVLDAAASSTDVVCQYIGTNSTALGTAASSSDAFTGVAGKGAGAASSSAGASGKGAGAASSSAGASGKGAGAASSSAGASGKGASAASSSARASGKGAGATNNSAGALAEICAVSDDTVVEGLNLSRDATDELGSSDFVYQLPGLECGAIESGVYVDPLEELGIFPSDSPTQVHAPGQCSEFASSTGVTWYMPSSSRSASFPPGRRSRRSRCDSATSEGSERVCAVRGEPSTPEPTVTDEIATDIPRIRVPTRFGMTLSQVLQQDCMSPELAEGHSTTGHVMKVEEDFYTPDVEGILRDLTSPLKVVHNVSPAEARKNLPDWVPASSAEVQALVDMKAIRRLTGAEAARESSIPGTQVLPAKTVYTVKPGAGGKMYRRKCRVVGCGNYEMKPGNLDVYAGGIPADVLRSCLVEASHRGLSAFITDIKNAFLLAPIPQAERTRIILRPPKVLELMNITQPGELWFVEKAMYGLRQSPRWWGDHRDSILSEATWTSSEHGQVRLVQSDIENNLWKMVTVKNETIGFIIVYVDDMMFLSTQEQAEQAHSWIKTRWECTSLEQATETNPITFLGVEIHLEALDSGEKGFALCQRAYIEELARSYAMKPVSRSAPVPKDWVREIPDLELQPSEDTVRKAQKVTGEVLWVAQRSRPDVAHCVGLMASWITKVPTHVYKLGIRLIEFLYSTMDQKLSMTPLRTSRPGVVIYTDASFAPYGSRSVSGIIVQYRGRNVLWKSQRQTIVCLSTAEAELVGACEGVVLGQSLTALLKEFDVALEPMRLLVDNLAAIVLAEGGGSTRTRHLRVRGSFIKNLIKAGELIPEHCPGDVQLADILTKILPGPRHQDLSEMLGLVLPTRIARVDQHEEGLQSVDESCLKGLKTWFISLMVMLQMQCGTSMREDDDQEGVSPELSLVIVMMALSVLFIWEAGKFCVRTCCSRGEHRVMSARLEDDDTRTRRARRQDAVRRAILSEAEGLRRRYGHNDDDDDGEETFVPSPPPPPQPSRDHQGSPGRTGLDLSSTARSSSYQTSSQGVGLARGPASPPPLSQGRERLVVQGEKREVGTQTEEPRGVTYEELHRLQVVTSTSRTPGVVHLFPGCHTLRGVTTNRRQFCRVCLQAAARSGI